jgi:hypothetical protein
MAAARQSRAAGGFNIFFVNSKRCEPRKGSARGLFFGPLERRF